MRGVWRDAELVDPNTHNNKLATYHFWFAIPFSRNERMPINVPRYLHLDLSKHVMRNVSRFRLLAHTLKVEAAAWLEDGSHVCDQCPGEDGTCSERGAYSFVLPRPSSLWAEETLFLSVFTFFRGLFSSPTLFAATGQQPTCSWFPFSAEQNTFSFSFWAYYGFICGWPRPVSSRSAKQPGWRSPPIVTIVTYKHESRKASQNVDEKNMHWQSEDAGE